MNFETEKRISQRVEAGIPGLEVILKGGLLNAGVYMIRGTPGAGKTTLASQFCFHHIGGGHTVIYVTLLSESHARLVQHLRSFSFFREEALASQFVLLSAFSILEAEGTPGVAKLLSREIHRRGATLLVLDGLSNIDDSVQSNREVKKFINELQSYALATNCTMLLLTSGSRELTSPEYTMVDGVIELDLVTREMRTERTLQVRKLRGTDLLSGCHYYRIAHDGITVFPRIDSVFTDIAQPDVDPSRKTGTGIPGLDAMVGGGLPAASTTLLLGPSGVGKTSLGLHFLSAASAEEPGLFFGFHESPDALMAKATALGLDLAARVADGTVDILWQPPYGQLMDALAYRMLENIGRRKVRRVFIDGLGGFERTAFLAERIQPTITALTNALRGLGVTTVVGCEMPDLVGFDMRPLHSDISAITDNLLMLRYLEFGSSLHRLISVLKMRASTFDTSLRHFDITDRGVRIGDRFEGKEHLLTGFARRSSPATAAPTGNGRNSG